MRGEARRQSGDCERISRRGFLRAGAVGGLAATLPTARKSVAAGRSDDQAVIFLHLVGGPSQLETWDPKPDAPAQIRGPMGSIATAIPGVRINENLPMTARQMGTCTLVRSMFHSAAPIHETGQQLIQTGRLSRDGEDAPHMGSVVARLHGQRRGAPPFVVLPGPIGETGVGISHGQSSGPLGADCDPVFRASAAAVRILESKCDGCFPPVRVEESPANRERYGDTRFGANCLQALRLVESGVRFVVVNMYETVFHHVSWDCHGTSAFSTLDDYARLVLPTFDRAFAALLDDLSRSGRLDATLVVATGEFGRSPRLNAAGGRDHWPGVWSALLAGGGIRGGQVIGASDARAAEPIDRPVCPADLVATIYRAIGIDHEASIATVGAGRIELATGGRPIAEAFV